MATSCYTNSARHRCLFIPFSVLVLFFCFAMLGSAELEPPCSLSVTVVVLVCFLLFSCSGLQLRFLSYLGLYLPWVDFNAISGAKGGDGAATPSYPMENSNKLCPGVRRLRSC